ncbi:MAG: hypothetical protein WCO13_06410 [Bacteroidota bacterium]
MIQYKIENEYFKVYFRKNMIPYEISLYDLGATIDWRIFEFESKVILAKNVSHWTLHLMVDKNLSIEFAYEFQEVIKKLCLDNKIDWVETEKALIICDEYRSLRAKVKYKSKHEITEIKRFLKEKYNLT